MPGLRVSYTHAEHNVLEIHTDILLRFRNTVTARVYVPLVFCAFRAVQIRNNTIRCVCDVFLCIFPKFICPYFTLRPFPARRYFPKCIRFMFSARHAPRTRIFNRLFCFFIYFLFCTPKWSCFSDFFPTAFAPIPAPTAIIITLVFYSTFFGAVFVSLLASCQVLLSLDGRLSFFFPCTFVVCLYLNYFCYMF